MPNKPGKRGKFRVKKIRRNRKTGEGQKMRKFRVKKKREEKKASKIGLKKNKPPKLVWCDIWINIYSWGEIVDIY